MWTIGSAAPRAWRNIYVYLRNRVSVEHDQSAIDRLEENINDRAWYLSFDRYGLWENGIVLKVRATRGCKDFMTSLKEQLEGFEEWAAVDDMVG